MGTKGQGRSGCPGSQSPVSCKFSRGQRRRNRECKYVQEPTEATGYRPQFHWDTTQWGEGGDMNGLELACASQKEPALGDGLPLLDANFPREEKRGWEELLKIPNSPSRSRRSWGRGWSEERPGQIEHKHHTHLMSLYYRLGRMIVGQRIGKEQLRPSSKLEDTQLPVTQTGQRRERHPSNSPVGGLRVSFVPSCTQA